MEIIKDIEIVDLALYLPKKKILVIGDIHIGYEEMLNKEGVLVPRFQFKDLLKRLGSILENTNPKTVVLMGDLKHEFGTISEQEWRETLKFLDFLTDKGIKVILIKGNHDTILGPIAKKRDVEIVDDYIVDDIAFMHGDKIRKTDKNIKTIVIGHEHPALSIRDGLRVETFKCFLLGKYEKKNLIVMPSFFLMTEGTDILKERLLSPFLKQDLDDFNAFIVNEDEKTLDFGRIRDIKKIQENK